jgi:hypothetical protein
LTLDGKPAWKKRVQIKKILIIDWRPSVGTGKTLVEEKALKLVQRIVPPSPVFLLNHTMQIMTPFEAQLSQQDKSIIQRR